MSRPSVAAQRTLTLTEELEKLEQSITLTLQEIDHNFSRAHRIVTTSILPIVEQYAEHSKDVWEGSKFWKQFFEASANVSLSGYEEPPADEETVTGDETATGTTPITSTNNSPQQPQLTPSNNDQHFHDTLTPSPTNSTPRPQRQKQPNIAIYPSPYETLKRETLNANDTPNSTLPSTPHAQVASPADTQSSPFAPPSTTHHTNYRTPANDIILHRVLDRNWRLQATPHSTARPLPYRTKSAPEATPRGATIERGRRAKENYDLDSSPAIAAPELHAEIFDTPARKGRIPGVSILTPARRKKPSAADSASRGKSKEVARGIWSDSDDDDDDDDGAALGMSPPKTMQFHVPQGRLMRTPAREASKRIVEDLLLTAGGNITDDFEEVSPSVANRGREDEDTF